MGKKPSCDENSEVKLYKPPPDSSKQNNRMFFVFINLNLPINTKQMMHLQNRLSFS